jgi:Flp pilus assembly protein TadG
MNTINHKRRKKGTILVLTAVSMLLMFALLAFAVDVGYLNMVRTQLQRTADAAAIAATWSLLDGEIANSPTAVESAQTTASQYTQLNKVLNSQPALAQSDVVVGYLSNPFNPAVQLDPSGALGYNAVQVQVQRTSNQNGSVPLFFARVLGIDQAGSRAMATAAFLSNVSGFQTPSDGSNLGILPFALDLQSWNTLAAGQGTDNWRYDPDTHQVSAGSDGIKEVNLFPQGTGSPGNRGTVDVGNPNNSTSDIARQILHGINENDLSYLGGRFALSENGTLLLNGDTGISAGVKDELASIKGQARVVPLFSSVAGQGNNAQYTIVQFVGIRIMDVRLTGSMSSKRVIIQPAPVFIKGTIAGGANQTSSYIYTPVCLVR